MSNLQTPLDRPYGSQPDTKAAVLAYLERTGNADVAEQAQRNKALVETGQRPWSKRAAAGLCPLCGSKPPKSGVCRKTLRCRYEAIRKELEAQ